jgi:hypothetical protein
MSQHPFTGILKVPDDGPITVETLLRNKQYQLKLIEVVALCEIREVTTVWKKGPVICTGIDLLQRFIRLNFAISLAYLADVLGIINPSTFHSKLQTWL